MIIRPNKVMGMESFQILVILSIALNRFSVKEMVKNKWSDNSLLVLAWAGSLLMDNKICFMIFSK